MAQPKLSDNITPKGEAPITPKGDINVDNITSKEEAPQKLSNYQLPKFERENRIFILSNDKRQGTVDLDVEEDVIDPNTNKPRRMRLLRGAPSVWFDEQPPSVYPKAYVDKNTMSLQFNRGSCIIPMNNPNAIMAAELTNRNISTRKRMGIMAKPKDIYFYEWDPIELNKKAEQEENDVIKAMQLAMTTPLEEFIPHAAYLNIPTADEQGIPYDETALRIAYIRVAKNMATKFLTSFHSPTVKISHMVRRAVNEGFIDLGRQVGAAYWTDGGFISTLPEGRDSIEYLTEFAMVHGSDNTAFTNQLRVLVG